MESLVRENQSYENCANVHDLPEIFHYWSNRHIRPKLMPFGFGSANEMFLKCLDERCAETPEQRFLSVGSGNCDLEIQLAVSLVANRRDGFVIDCLDVNPEMLGRGRSAAKQLGVGSRLRFIESDFNTWKPPRRYDAVIANQSLHHVVNLEGLFDRIKGSLQPGGLFLISDMIGRNGHQRWPEALDMDRRFWRKLPPSYRFNWELKRYEELYQDWDCSREGFEGVRSQDILPLLIDRFHFHLFISFGNVIDPFVDRSFGPNFDIASEWDREFIDQVHRLDEEELSSGRLTPTHMLAVLGNEPSRAILETSPASCVRSHGKTQPEFAHPQGNYEWQAWPHSVQRELELACERLVKCGEEITHRTIWALQLENELERTRKEIRDYLHNPLRYAARLVKGLWRRTKNAPRRT